MNVNTKEQNPALKSLFENCEQVIFLDANFFIAPDRSRIAKLEEIPDGCAEMFPFELIDELKAEFLND